MFKETFSDLEDAKALLEDALTLRMYGEDIHTPKWREWETRCETYLRQLRDKENHVRE